MIAMFRAFAFGICLALAPAAQAEAADADQRQALTVFAAASLTDALEALAKQYRESGGGEVRFSFAASSTLARQIEAGAPADIFVSANEEWMDYLAGRTLIDPSTRTAPVGNALVLIAPADSPLGTVTIARGLDIPGLLGTGGKLVTGDPAHVPVGIYARQAFERLGMWAVVEPLLARTDSVRAALALVERGEAPLGIVYATDARASSGVKVVGVFPADSHPPVTYPYAILAGRDTASVRRFFEYVTTGQAAKVYESLGFTWKGPTG
jgi:molybdate transport system substrate-binding protein